MSDRETRRAENEAVFRAANENLSRMAERGEASPPRFICECNRADCLEMFALTLDDYSAVRRDPTRFVLVEGHENEPDEEIVERRDGLVIVEKTGSGEEVAGRLADP